MKLILIVAALALFLNAHAADTAAPSDKTDANTKLLINRQTDGELANPRQFKEYLNDSTSDEDAGLALARTAMDRSGFHNSWMKMNSSCGFQDITAVEFGRKVGRSGSETVYLVSRTADCKPAVDGIAYLVKIISPNGERKKATRVTWKLVASPFQP